MNDLVVTNGDQREAAFPTVGTASDAALNSRMLLQYEIAARRPRRPSKVRDNLLEIVTLDPESAQESMYALPRGGKPVTGPSIRFAEALKQAWGNCWASSEVKGVNYDEKYVESIGFFIDFETNAVTEFSHQRSIAGRNGKIFNADMIRVTANAASSIAMREAILKGVPKPIWRAAYEAVTKVIAGDVMTLAENREKAIRSFAIYGVKADQVLQAIQVSAEADITLDHIAIMRGMFAAIKNGEETVESIFFAPAAKTAPDPNYNPMVREKTDPTTGEVTNDSTATGGGDEVGKTAQGQTRPADASETGNRSAAAADGGQAGAKPATDSDANASNEAERRSEGSADRENGKTTSSAETNGSIGVTSGGGEQSPNQSDLLSSQTSDSKDQPDASRQDGADGSREEVPSAADRLHSYSKALLGIESGGPPKLAKQSDLWIKKYGTFTGADEKKRSQIYAVHLNRLTGSINVDACKSQVEGIIG